MAMAAPDQLQIQLTHWEKKWAFKLENRDGNNLMISIETKCHLYQEIFCFNSISPTPIAWYINLYTYISQ